MNTQLHISYLGLVRNVIGRSEEELEVLAGTTVGQLLRLLADQHGPSVAASTIYTGFKMRR